MTLRLLGISGSLRARSTNRQLLEAFARAARRDPAVDVFCGIGDLPIFNPDIESDQHEPVERLGRAVGSCHGILLAVPEYAHGIPGGLKNALDWLVSRFEIPGKPAMLVHGSARSSTSREHLREVLQTMSCRVYDGPEFEVHLVGKQADEIDALLAAPHMRSAMGEALTHFASFIRNG